jgi:ATP-dependent RNA helicase HelY
VDIAGGARQGRYLVLSRLSREGGARLLALATSGRTVTISARDVTSGSVKAGVIELPLPYRPRDRRFQQSALRLLRKIPPASRAGPATPAAPARPVHPVAACPDLEAHLRARRRAERTAQRIELLRSNLRRSGVGLVEEFHAILRLLGGLGYVEGWTLTTAGERLRFIYNELDLLLAETVERGIMRDLDPSELAALCSCFVYEPRAEEGSNPPWPTPDLAVSWKEIEDLAAELNDRERGERLSTTRKPEPGFAALAWAWAEGSSLEDLPNMKLQPGDFVRVSRQLVDLLRQLRDAAPDMSAAAREALLRIDRGVVAATGFA